MMSNPKRWPRATAWSTKSAVYERAGSVICAHLHSRQHERLSSSGGIEKRFLLRTDLLRGKRVVVRAVGGIVGAPGERVERGGGERPDIRPVLARPECGIGPEVQIELGAFPRHVRQFPLDGGQRVRLRGRQIGIVL